MEESNNSIVMKQKNPTLKVFIVGKKCYNFFPQAKIV